MASATEQQRLRLDLGLAADDTTSLPDATIDDLFDEVGETYSDSATIKAATRVLALERMLVQAAAQVDYQQNNTSEKASQRFAQLNKLLEKWQGKLDDAIAAAGSGAARFGRTTRRPARIREYPGTWGW